MNTLILHKFAYRASYQKRGRPRKYPMLWEMLRLLLFSYAQRICEEKGLDVGYVSPSDELLKPGYTLLQRRLRREVRGKFNLRLDEVTFRIQRRKKEKRLLVVLP